MESSGCVVEDAGSMLAQLSGSLVVLAQTAFPVSSDYYGVLELF